MPSAFRSNAEVAESAEKRQERWAGRARWYHPAMKPRPRIRKFFKWGGLVVSALLLTVWVGSACNQHLYATHRGFSLDVNRGRVQLTRPHEGVRSHQTSVHWSRPWETRFEWSAKFERKSFWWYVIIPLWPFVALSLATTAAAWRMDIIARRKSRLGACPACGYDRTGLAPAAPCPECNAKA